MVLGSNEARGRTVLAEEWFHLLDTPDKQRFIFEGAGHRAHFDQPDLFADMMRTVLDRTYDTGEAPGGSSLEDGEHFVLVLDVTPGSITVDPTEFLTGDEAAEAARE